MHISLYMHVIISLLVKNILQTVNDQFITIFHQMNNKMYRKKLCIVIC